MNDFIFKLITPDWWVSLNRVCRKWRRIRWRTCAQSSRRKESTALSSPPFKERKRISSSAENANNASAPTTRWVFPCFSFATTWLVVVREMSNSGLMDVHFRRCKHGQPTNRWRRLFFAMCAATGGSFAECHAQIGIGCRSWIRVFRLSCLTQTR